MITLTVIPRNQENLYSLLVKKEVDLRRNRQGTLHRHGGKKRHQDKWVHKSFSGAVKFQKCLGETLVALVHSRDEADEWKLLSSFVGFLHRHFKDYISSITLTYEEP